ncbi:MAG: ATP-binding protein [Bacteroidota bacterium]
MEASTHIATDVDVTVTNCDREPIHIPGTVQAHGALLVVDRAGAVVQVSANVGIFIGRESQDVLNQPCSACFVDADGVRLMRALGDGQDWSELNPLPLVTHSGVRVNVIGHRQEGGTVLELEPSEDAIWYPEPQPVQRAIRALNRAATVEALQDAIVTEVKRLTGFDRVMLYRFDRDWNGAVVAEAAREGIGSFLGLRFPASDIPAQARTLYAKNTLRLIPTVEAETAALVPERNPLTRERLDQSACVLRSVSPIHIQYLKNMGVAASMSISVLDEGRLWGLIACHHYAPRYVPYRLRAASDLLGQVFSMQFALRRKQFATSVAADARQHLTRLVERTVEAEHITSVLCGMAEDKHGDEYGEEPGRFSALDLFDADGIAVCLEDEVCLLGQTPSSEHVYALLDWIADRNHEAGRTLVQTDSLRDVLPARLAPIAKDCAGMLAVSVADDWTSAVVWFRKEEPQTVTWGGQQKQAHVEEDGTLTLHPRASFEAWQEQVTGQATAWSDADVEMAGELRRVLVRVILQRAEELARLNADLTRSNAELDAFAYIASHDLKEPLRGITNYAQFLIEDYADELGDDGQAKLLTIARLGQRLDTFIDSLLEYSRVGRHEFTAEEVPIERALEESKELVHARLSEKRGRVDVVGDLPVVLGDAGRIVDVFANLISNGLKYNESEPPIIEVGSVPVARLSENQLERLPENHVLLFVRDNGIGIRPRHFEAVFGIFRRLHGRDQYGGGSGAGLTIVRRIVERHGGVVWVTSDFGEGSTFFFSFPVAP